VSVNNYITSSCLISNNAVCKNGKSVFVNNNADLPNFLFSVYKHLEINYARFYKMDSLSKLGWLAAEVLLKDSFKKEVYNPEEVGIILCNANASLDTDLKYVESIKDTPSPSLFVYTLPNIVVGEISIRNNFKGEDAFFVSERFDTGFIESYVNNLLNSGTLEACICGWVELLGDEYKAALFLVEKTKTGAETPFAKDQMEDIFNIKVDVS
jgi:hypothetical protein